MGVYSSEDVRKMVVERMNNIEYCKVVDETGTGDKFVIYVVSPDFDKKPLIARHRMVHEAMAEELKEAIHAVTIKAWTPAQYEQKKSEV
mmetsp:Transcript_19942/g.50941  ORF Transcript_19942/g.50941 Transcript_19942/m.50941 type:complete len:89 (+) Transcript_19942:66-332(+)|eukprot:CAMPEP_0113873604 /NCGR_PEP_ID=MMETSP0780_2-20120614/3864_1 /TAXON_ID=652834 /ORGANISM="Palpitomonas bilix" /LENGTH=88 /DNA_ID=CAMNT_0000859271 /DNA_START=66 /DNA_END=332 /DNA_ORIENTATION=- /assembly_acc=CAM_ASM_000599